MEKCLEYIVYEGMKFKTNLGILLFENEDFILELLIWFDTKFE